MFAVVIVEVVVYELTSAIGLLHGWLFGGEEQATRKSPRKFEEIAGPASKAPLGECNDL